MINQATLLIVAGNPGHGRLLAKALEDAPFTPVRLAPRHVPGNIPNFVMARDVRVAELYYVTERNVARTHIDMMATLATGGYVVISSKQFGDVTSGGPLTIEDFLAGAPFEATERATGVPEAELQSRIMVPSDQILRPEDFDNGAREAYDQVATWLSGFDTTLRLVA